MSYIFGTIIVAIAMSIGITKIRQSLKRRLLEYRVLQDYEQRRASRELF